MESNMKITYKTWAEINIPALVQNYAEISSFVSKRTPGCRTMCIIKADAYGHDAKACAVALSKAGARDFAVSSIDEALDVSGLDGFICNTLLILGYTPVDNALILMRNNIVQTVFSLDYAKLLNDKIQRSIDAGIIPADAKLRVHIKVDTGMNRLGIRADGRFDNLAVEEIRELTRLPHLAPEGIFTHFACSDVDASDMTATQYSRFDTLIRELHDSGIDFETKHCCNSAAITEYPDFHRDMVRAGLILYGLSPLEHKNPLHLRPVMRFCTTVSHIHELMPGDTVSYGAIFTATKEMRVATLAVGYADGFVRAFGNGGGVMLNGKFAPIIGRICMDQCMVDIGDIPVKPGDVATIFDGSGTNIEKLAQVANTINYELVCLVGKRVPRIICR